MKSPYGLMADLHLHSWSAFSSVDSNGVNTRLAGLIAEIKRCVAEVVKAGGDTLYLAGDVFHVRGSISPSVLNPVMDALTDITYGGFKIVALAGNHDLEGKSSTRLGSAITALEGVGVNVINEPDSVAKGGVLLVPWIESVKDLKAYFETIDAKERVGVDLIMHAPIDGVLDGIPSHGLDPAYLAKLGFKRVFSGHYHNHKEFPGGVYSIGALAHHTWSDVNTKAGFLIVHEDHVRWMKSHLPEFVDITGEIAWEDASLAAEGNFVRAKVTTSKMSEVEQLRDAFTEAGAKGVIIQTIKTAKVERSGAVMASVSAGGSLEASIAEWVRTTLDDKTGAVARESLKVLAEAMC